MKDPDTDQLEYIGEYYYQDSVILVVKGFFIEFVKIQTIFTTIDFSKNKFQGEIPRLIGKLKSLKGLNFSHNNLIGSIPSSFGNLSNLEWLDLSSNELVGEIPQQLTYMISLSALNLLRNRLVGPVPCGKQFDTLITIHIVKTWDYVDFHYLKCVGITMSNNRRPRIYKKKVVGRKCMGSSGRSS
nr:receptor-like protein 43 [Ziziphus jujuba var. spinosa]